MAASPQQLTIASGVFYLLYFLLPANYPLLTIGVGLAIILLTILHLSLIIRFLSPNSSFIERLSLAIPSFFIGFPLLLYIAYASTSTLHPAMPISLSGLIFITSIGLEIWQKERKQEHVAILDRLFFKVLACFTLIIVLLVFWYKPLPDLDPYGWIQTLEPQLQNSTLPAITERPFFAGLTYTFISILSIDIFTFFKYIFPFFSITILVPLWLIIRNEPKTIHKILFALYLLAIPSTALYLTTPTPQAIFIIFSVYAMAYILYSSTTKNQLFFFAAGAILLFSFFYHQIASILFLPWFVVSIIYFRKSLFSKKENVIIAIFLLAFLRNQLRVIIDFIYYWFNALYAKFFSGDILNLHYPAQYVNIDQNQMGWPGISGVLKFYSYYASPLVLLVIILSLFFLLTTIKKRGWNILLKKEYAVILLSFFIFFSIAELFPRIPNIALLPERAWIFVSIFTLPFLLFLIHTPKSKRAERAITTLMSLCLIIGILGTLYVNSLKKFLITPEQIISAQWIQEYLPKDKIIYGYNNNNLILFHAKSPYSNFQENILCADVPLEYVLNYLDPNKGQKEELQRITEHASQIQKDINSFVAAVEHSTPSDLSSITQNTEIQRAQRLINELVKKQENVNTSDPLAKAKGIPLNIPAEQQAISATTSKFIYFAPPHPRNPYNSRGYNPSHWGVSSCNNGEFLFDKYPERFRRIYEENEIIIWKER